MVTVSQPANINQVQDQIASFLGMDKLPNDILLRREKLWTRLGNGSTILLILDDIWSTLDLAEDLGIPVRKRGQSAGCKIVFTSRNQDLCIDMGSQRVIPVKPMPSEEAWKLFTEVVHEVFAGELDKTGTEGKIFDKCGMLPIAIKAVGKALRRRNKNDWGDLLKNLNGVSSSENPVIKDVYPVLKTSVDFLNGENAKPCFLLCSLFPEDHDIPVERLAHYGMGLEIFRPSPGSIADARLAARNAVRTLKQASLLLDGKDDYHVKMHDIIRDVAIAIASRGVDWNHKFLVRAGVELRKWPEVDSLKEYSGISFMRNRVSALPAELECPKLEILLLEDNGGLEIPSECFQEMKNMKVLNFNGCRIHNRLPSSISSLTTLHTLHLRGAYVWDISSLGALKTLEILDVCGTYIKDIPKQIGCLTNLRHLDITECRELRSFAHGVISSLRKLENLHIGKSFKSWEVEEEGKQTSNASLSELKSLSNLNNLDVRIPNIELLPEDLVFEPLEWFHIVIGTDDVDVKGFVGEGYERNCALVVENCWASHRKVLSCTKKLGKDIEYFRLNGEEHWNIMDNPFHIEFSKLRYLRLENCCGFSCLTDLAQSFCNLEELYLYGLKELTHICDERLPITNGSFHKVRELRVERCPKLTSIWGNDQCEKLLNLSNLERLSIYSCDKLKSVFPKGAIRELVSLKDLWIVGCHSLEEVFVGEEMELHGGGESSSTTQNNIIFLPSVRSVRLRFLPCLESFNSEPYSTITQYPSLRRLTIDKCEKMKRWGNGIHLTPNLELPVAKYGPGLHTDESVAVELKEDENGKQFSILSNKDSH